MDKVQEQILYESRSYFNAVLYQTHRAASYVLSPEREGVRVLFGLQGNVRMWTMGIEALLGTGQVAVFPSEQRCELKWPDGEARLLQIVLMRDTNAERSNSIKNAFFSQRDKAFLPLLSEEEKEKIRMLLVSFCRELQGKEEWRLECADLILQQVEIFLMRSMSGAAGQGEQPLGAPYERSVLVKKAIHYIHQHYDEKITLEEMARKLWVNPSYLSRQFKLNVGISFTEFLQQKRIYMAKSLLVNSSQTVGSIAVSVGFQTIPHFNSVFKRLTGQSPMEFRRRWSDDQSVRKSKAESENNES